MEEILLNKPGQKIILLGNESIVRGALESGVQFISTYPGTPASEIGDVFAKIQKSKPKSFHFEYSTNEKVALEAGIGASFSGLKTLVAMKNFGLNVALDALFPFVYTGTKGPTVIVVADDPSCHSSAQSEENSRGLSLTAHIPTLEPSDPQECKDFVKLGFEISERFKIPVMIRETTRVAHQKMPVKLGAFKKIASIEGKFIKNPKQFVTLPPRVLEMKSELLEKIEKIKEVSEKSEMNSIKKKSSKGVGIITSGISHLYVMESLKELNLNLPVFKLGFFYPLPEKKIKNFIKGLKKVLIAEELEPYLEKEILVLAKEVNCNLEVFGKNLIPETGELKPEIITFAIAKVTNKKFSIPDSKFKSSTIKRFPQLCPGCPYWFVFNGLKKAVDPKQVVFGGDIGCYMLAGFPPHFVQDYLSCMGSSIGIAHGIKKSTKQKVITLIGDSTFFHSGIPALINTVFNKSNPLIVILDNQTTAMTGHQPHPGACGIKMENIVRACGVKNLKIIDPANQAEFLKTIKEFLNKKEVSVIIARHPCIFVK
ncbi:thiamine pyrophosphate-dependent enzyme [Patescibacteria group bacterium]